jgi:two-component system, chemotaxis family, chemotaxis protein CheY
MKRFSRAKKRVWCASSVVARNQTVLLIDDDADVRAGLHGLLHDAGMSVVEATNGRHALNYLTSSVSEPDLVVTNLAMPDMNGWEFINIMQAYIRLSNIPVVVVSGYDPNAEGIRPKDIAEYVTKPVVPDRFVAAVRRHLRVPVEH